MSMHRIGHILEIQKSNAFYSSEPNRKVRVVSVDSPSKKYVVEVLDGPPGAIWTAPMGYIDNNYKRVANA
jgi:hypothetical protein